MLKRFICRCRQLWRSLFVSSVRGNPLHEAWDQHGEPLPRLNPADIAHASGFCNGIHARGV